MSTRQAQHTPAAEVAVGTREAASLLGVSPRTLEGWRSRGGGPPFRKYPGGRAAYVVRELLAWRDRPGHVVAGGGDA